MTTTATSTVTATTAESPHLEALQRDGFVIVRSILVPDEVAILREASSKAASMTRAGNWPYLRSVPKQFPPWPNTPPPSSEGGIWGVQHLMHPEMPDREAFIKAYFSPKILAVAEELLGVSQPSRGEPKKELLVMELFNLLVAPENKAFELRWHRDDIPESVSPERELELLCHKSPEGKQSHAQYNLALCPDTSLIVVPGSHRRVRTEIERAAGPYEPTLPNQLIVKLEPGDAVFYDSNILHRGIYQPKAEGNDETRLTLHGSVGLKDTTNADNKVRATAVLQHGIGFWINRDDAVLGVGERAENMRSNLISLGRGDNVGYSLEG
ncbi:phytanoyl-CoA dioxygenase family protein [Talaromyces proteolyticus]|uniref:Phytanoyl-CoA dioxygenase family protein n=1 Tax=Talaromyces proteolyticus TaxID=1131652 RepID=A0AAD4PZU9_9EURO|nr:phytanoyl-CoA dioxygenase family protein [Talaromyces proteolyticus]KAH8696742.1 phytanoyl-CoA dioxygenase family protein [Talaromyces proteolyticus]